MRIAVHPSALRVIIFFPLCVAWFAYVNIILCLINVHRLMQLGYGSAAVDLLTRYSPLHCFSLHLYGIHEYMIIGALILILIYTFLDTDLV